MSAQAPWDDEPDSLEFSSLGYHCQIWRHDTLRHLCGYIDVPMGHPWHGKHYDEVRTADGEWPAVHGGLTYAGYHSTPSGLWRLGFDCAHCGDHSPGAGLPRMSGEEYRTVEYVRAQCEGLARQAAEVQS